MKELQAELRAKQASIEEMSGSAKNARFKELEVRCSSSCSHSSPSSYSS